MIHVIPIIKKKPQLGWAGVKKKKQTQKTPQKRQKTHQAWLCFDITIIGIFTSLYVQLCYLVNKEEINLLIKVYIGNKFVTQV